MAAAIDVAAAGGSASGSAAGLESDSLQPTASNASEITNKNCVKIRLVGSLS
jgi:hypothetical protein